MFTFKQFLLEDEEKPKVTHLKSTGSTVQHHEFEVSHPKLTSPARISIIQGSDKTYAHVDVTNNNKNPEKQYESMGKLGTKHVMHVLGRIKHHVPELETVGGTRITGAHKGIARNPYQKDSNTMVSIKHVKPIPPD